MPTSASYFEGLVHDTWKVRVLPDFFSFEVLQSLDGSPFAATPFMSFTIAGVKQIFCVMPFAAERVNSHRPGRISGACAAAGAAATTTAAIRSERWNGRMRPSGNRDAAQVRRGRARRQTPRAGECAGVRAGARPSLARPHDGELRTALGAELVEQPGLLEQETLARDPAALEPDGELGALELEAE